MGSTEAQGWLIVGIHNRHQRTAASAEAIWIGSSKADAVPAQA